MGASKRLEQFREMQGAPDWYGTPFDKLHFEWSHEEKLEVERYCEKILINVAEEEMPPIERLKATFEGKPRDRVLMHLLYGNVYGTRTLDSAANALKPIDVYRNPKLWVKVHLATVARFKLDYANAYVITYGENLWGGHGKMIEYGNPVMFGEPPIKSVEDLEGFIVPDTKKHGLYPGYLWAIREFRRIYDEYGLSKVMPIFPRICGDPHSIVMMYMMGWAPFAKSLRTGPELAKRCLELATQFEINYGQTMIDVARPQALYMCAMTGVQDPQGNEWLADYWARIGKALAPQVPIVYGYGFGKSAAWIPILYDRGALGPGSFSGGLHDQQCDPKLMLDLHRERDLYVASMGSERVLLGGPASAIEDGVKQLAELGKPYPRFSVAIGMVDYWTPQSNVDIAITAAKKYGKY